MATVTTTQAQLDPGTSTEVTLANTGSERAVIVHPSLRSPDGTQILWPGQTLVITPRGTAIQAYTPTGTTTVTTSTYQDTTVDSFAELLATGGGGGASAATLAADPAFTGTYARKVADWATGVAYAVGELVSSGGTLYRCTTAHTSSGSFAAGNFTAIGGGGGGAVSSVVGQTGAVTGTQILADATVTAALAAKAAAAHAHSAADITSGTLPLARGGTGGTDAATARTALGLGGAATLGVGTAAGTVAAGDAPAAAAAAATLAQAFGTRSGEPIQPWEASPALGAELWQLANFQVGAGYNSSTLTPSVSGTGAEVTLRTRASMPPETAENVNNDQTYRLEFDWANTLNAGWGAISVLATNAAGTVTSGSAEQFLATNNMAAKSGHAIYDFKPPAGCAVLELRIKVWNNATSGALGVSNVTLRRTGDVSPPMMISKQYATGEYQRTFTWLHNARSGQLKAVSSGWGPDGALLEAIGGMDAYATAQPFVGAVPDPYMANATGSQHSQLSEQVTATAYSVRVGNNDQIFEVWNGSAYEYRGNTHGGETLRSPATWRVDPGAGAGFVPYTPVRSLSPARRVQVLLPTQIQATTAGSPFANVDHTVTMFPDGMCRVDRTTTFLAATTIRQHFEWMSSHSTSTPYLGRLGRGLTVLDEVDTHNKAAAPALTPSTSTTGGILAAATYSYRITAITPYGESTPSTAVTQATTGTTSTVTLSWSAAANATGYRIYGRTAGVERLLGTAAATATSWTDDGSPVPGTAAAPSVSSARYYSGTNAMDSAHSTDATWAVWLEPRNGVCFGNIFDRESVAARAGVAAVRTRLEMGSGIHKNYTNSEWTAGASTTVAAGTVWSATHYAFCYIPTDESRWHEEIAYRAANLASLASVYPAI